MKKTVDSTGSPAGLDLPAIEREARWQQAAQNALTDLASRGLPFTSADVVGMVGPPPMQSLLPTLLRWGHRRELIHRSRGAHPGTVWIGVHPSDAPARVGTGRRRCDIELNGIWPQVWERAERERISANELVARAVLRYLES